LSFEGNDLELPPVPPKLDEDARDLNKGGQDRTYDRGPDQRQLLLQSDDL
jgi:hypothetical protein